MSQIEKHSPAIVLCTLNAKYIHASLGLRYLMANMARHGSHDLAQRTVLTEFTLAKPIQDMALELLNQFGPELPDRPQIIGFGVYIWNVIQTTALVKALKAQRPRITIVWVDLKSVTKPTPKKLFNCQTL